MNGKGRRAAIYARISLDKTKEEKGVTNQAKDCHELCGKREYEVVETYIDNDIQVLERNERPQYEAMMEAVARGEVDVIVCAHMSRLWRNRAERAEGIDYLKRHRVSLLPIRGTEFDLTTATGRTMAGVVGEFDTMESEIKSERQCDEIRHAAMKGTFRHGGNRPYGYARSYVQATGKDGKPKTVVVESIDETEAAVIGDCARRLLAGESLNSVTRDLNARRVPTVTGAQWSTTSLRLMMCSARISGRREHTPVESWKGKRARPVCGEIVGPLNKEMAIVSADDSDRLRLVLTNPARRKTPVQPRKTMLTGLLVCSSCGRGMASRPRAGEPRYVCTGNPGTGSCGRMAVNGRKADERMRDVVLTALRSPELTERLRRRADDAPDAVARIAADEQELELLSADYGNGEITRAEWKAARAPIVARIDTARARLARRTRTSALDGFTGSTADMLARWEALNTSQRRAVVDSIVENVTVNKPRTPNRFDPERFEVIWR